ncbi:class I histocompatibility antigen, F10 alpha chain-like [Protopterus annectens]|uniref:class I histocompatibility antigen, F10 alpha chain-like n=1 Tax=Protopterus annectens TaxID=7888 RepID=UPI001CFB8DB0|nr:class I histocompatibility antigen, F10 alpha chain-like [Protopterus annectens]
MYTKKKNCQKCTLTFYKSEVLRSSEKFPVFVIVTYLNDIRVATFDNITKIYEPRVHWLKKNVDQSFWNELSQVIRNWEVSFRSNRKALMGHINQTTDTDTFQVTHGCHYYGDGTSSGFAKYGINGHDFIAFDYHTQTWTAATPQAVIIKNRWNLDTVRMYDWKLYFKKNCVDWIKKHVEYVQSRLDQKDKPVVHVTGQTHSNEKWIICTVTGFYPKDVDVCFIKNGEIRVDSAMSTGILRNSDDTYYVKIWIVTELQDENKYSCHVEHSSLSSVLIKEWEPEHKSNINIVIGAVVFFLAACATFGVFICKKNLKGGKDYTPASRTDQSESSSMASSNSAVTYEK